MMVVMMAIDLFRAIQVGEGAAAKLFMLAQLALLLSADSGCLGAPAAFSLRVNLLAHLHGHQPLHIRDVSEGARQVSVLRVRLLEMLNGAGEKFQRFLVMPLPSHHAPMGGIYVTQRDVIVSVAQRGLSLVQDARGLAVMPFLEEQPAFQ